MAILWILRETIRKTTETTEMNEKTDIREINAILAGSQLEHLAIFVYMIKGWILAYKYDCGRANISQKTKNWIGKLKKDLPLHPTCPPHLTAHPRAAMHVPKLQQCMIMQGGILGAHIGPSLR